MSPVQYVPTLDDVLFQCIWHDKRSNCGKYFFPIWTTEGLCFTFNLLNATELYTERRLRSSIPTTIVDPSGYNNAIIGNASVLDSIRGFFERHQTQPAANNDTATTTTPITTAAPKPRKAPNTLTQAGKIRRATLERMYPRRVSAASDNLVVEMRLFDKDTDYLCDGPVQGFKLLLHTVHETPQVDKYFYRVPLDHETIVSVKPELMDTSDTLAHYQPER